MTVGSRSIYQLAEVIEPVNNVGNLVAPPYLDIRPRITEIDPEDRLVRVGNARTWGEVGFYFLQDATAWQVIADLSDVIDPFTELTEGVVLRVPSQDRYYFHILPGRL